MSPPFSDRATIVAKLNALAGYDTTGEPNGPTGVGDRWVRIGPMKVFIDGGMLNGTAYMREPWGVGETYQITEPAYRGLLFVDPDHLAIIAEEAARRGWQMTAHCAGEAGMDELLTAYAARRPARRHPGPSLADHPRQLHLGGEPPAMRRAGRRRRPPARLALEGRAHARSRCSARGGWSGSTPTASGWDAGITIGGGSDHMIRMDPIAATNPWDPWLGIWVAVTRKVEGGGPLNLDQRLTRAEAIRFYTINNARLHFEEREKGSIEPGKLADLILVDRDPLTCPEDDLPSTKVLWTMVGGKVVFTADAGSSARPVDSRSRGPMNDHDRGARPRVRFAGAEVRAGAGAERSGGAGAAGPGSRTCRRAAWSSTPAAGRGWSPPRSLDAGLRVVGVDLSREMIERARKRCAAHGDRATFLQVSVFDRQLDALGPFDGAISRYVLHHVVDPSAFVARQVELLRPGGVLVVCDHLTDPDPDRAEHHRHARVGARPYAHAEPHRRRRSSTSSPRRACGKSGSSRSRTPSISTSGSTGAHRTTPRRTSGTCS